MLIGYQGLDPNEAWKSKTISRDEVHRYQWWCKGSVSGSRVGYLVESSVDAVTDGFNARTRS